MENNKSLELIKAEIERLENMDYPCDTSEQATGFYNALDCLSAFIDSLPEEKPSEDLEEEIQMEWDSFNKHIAKYSEGTDEVVWLNWLSFVDIANYFYELGLNAKEDNK